MDLPLIVDATGQAGQLREAGWDRQMQDSYEDAQVGSGAHGQH
jgi:hypothetical protein